MAEIEELTAPLKKLGKKKNLLIFGGVGLAAGVVALLFSKSSGGGEEEPVLESASAGESDQAVSALGSQMQAFAQAVKNDQDSIVSQLSKTNEALEEANSVIAEMNTANQQYQTTTSQNQADIVSQMLELQRTQEAAVVAPVQPVNLEPDDYRVPVTEHDIVNPNAYRSHTAGKTNVKIPAAPGSIDYDKVRAATVTTSGKTQASRDAAYERYKASGYTDDNARQDSGPG